MFVFGGRRANMELQLPFIHRILAENPDAEYHLWNLARDPDDAEWIKDADDNHPRIHVMNQFVGQGPVFDEVFRHYTAREFKGCRFVKLDDDVVFIETQRFADFVSAIGDNPGAVISGKVINNGACTPTEPMIMERFHALKIRLLDVHLHASYAVMSHDYLASHFYNLVGQKWKLIKTEDWLSINFIGYDWAMGVRIADLLGTPAPRNVAGRKYNPGRHKLGDEGVVNTLPRIIVQGMLIGHLYFGPQAKHMSDDLLNDLRGVYAIIGKEYLQ